MVRPPLACDPGRHGLAVQNQRVCTRIGHEAMWRPLAWLRELDQPAILRWDQRQANTRGEVIGAVPDDPRPPVVDGEPEPRQQVLPEYPVDAPTERRSGRGWQGPDGEALCHGVADGEGG
jgi:hypothetical protein